MTITRHPLHNSNDLPRIFQFIQSLPITTRHIIDLPWRLSSIDLPNNRNAVYWEDANSNIVAFAAWMAPWASLDIFIQPGPTQTTIESDLFTWADQRFRELDAERGHPLPYWTDLYQDDHAKRQLVETYGFLEKFDGYVYLQSPLTNLPPIPALPTGFTLRPLAGDQETAAYAELHRTTFDSTYMNAAWRSRTLHMPTYRPELDLIIVAPDNQLAGFCIGWFSPQHQLAQIEPLGIHPNFQQLGLSRTLLLSILHRFQSLGATHALVETDFERTSARRAYESVGFTQINTVCFAGKTMTNSSSSHNA